MNDKHPKTRSGTSPNRDPRFTWLPWLVLCALTASIAWITVQTAIVPAYRDRQSRLYTSRLGYLALLRSRNEPLPVVTRFPEHRDIAEAFVGEGFVRSTPILVPIVPIGRIANVLVKEGDCIQKGQTLAELDIQPAKIRLEAARTMLVVAKAELERTKIGSSYLLEKERPAQDAIRVSAAEEQIQIRKQLDEMYERLFKEQAISRAELLSRKSNTVEVLERLQTARLSLEQSLKGRAQSILIAAATVREAELAVEQRKVELNDHRIVAPADGKIERRLIQAGEYNQDAGKPAFLLASGQWFEAYFDQTVIGRLSVGDRTRVSLEAFAGIELQGTVVSIHPFVSFHSSGPETTRPIRPSGTGSPEWPSTFSVRIEFEAGDLPVVTGLSGLARLARYRRALAVPSGALTSKTAAEAIVMVRDGKTFARRNVSLGATADGWTEILDGLSPEDEVIVAGHLDLLPGDHIRVEQDGEALALVSARGE